MARKLISIVGVLAVAAVAATSLWHRPEPSAAPVAGRQVVAKTAAESTGARFEGVRAYDLLKAQCDFGPRPPGSEAHEKTSAWLQERMKAVTDEVVLQKWDETITEGPGKGRTYPSTNIFGIVRGTADEGKDPEKIVPDLMLSAHWDTRPVADEDPNPANRNKPIIGANDGASGVAVLLEMARVLQAERPRKTIVFALWDVEDLGSFLHGARHFATNSRKPEWKRLRARQGILLDMIGDADLQCIRDTTSVEYAPALWDDFHRAADEVSLGQHFNGKSIGMIDDHVPLNQAGIPTIDLIDFDYPQWHTLGDTADKCSAASLEVIGDVILHFIRRGPKT